MMRVNMLLVSAWQTKSADSSLYVNGYSMPQLCSFHTKQWYGM